MQPPATCIIVPAVAGDIFYSDGTWSDVLEDSKTPIGVVFWTGNPTADDPTLEADFPQCTHGLVISLYEESGNDKPWQDNSDEILIGEWVEANTEYISITSGRAGSAHNNLNRIMGYNNTKAIEAYNAANSGREVTCVQRAVAFRTSVKAPGGTSDWYMPSAKEVSLLCTGIFDGDIAKINDVDYDPVKMTANMRMINGVLSKIEGAAPLDGFAGYWSSSEESAETAYEVYFANGQLYNWPKNYPGPRDVYRFVFAF